MRFAERGLVQPCWLIAGHEPPCRWRWFDTRPLREGDQIVAGSPDSDAEAPLECRRVRVGGSGLVRQCTLTVGHEPDCVWSFSRRLLQAGDVIVAGSPRLMLKAMQEAGFLDS